MWHYLMAFYGSLVFAVVMFVIEKNGCDNKEIDFPYVKYCKKNWDNWLFTGLIAPILVWYMADIIAIINARTGWNLNAYEVYYLGAGLLVELIYIGLAILFKWKEKFFPEVHKD